MNDQVRGQIGADGQVVILGAWCPRCEREVMPSSHGQCLWHEPPLRILDFGSLSFREISLAEGEACVGGTRAGRKDAAPVRGCVGEAESSEGESGPIAASAEALRSRSAGSPSDSDSGREPCSGREGTSEPSAAIAPALSGASRPVQPWEPRVA